MCDDGVDQSALAAVHQTVQVSACRTTRGQHRVTGLVHLDGDLVTTVHIRACYIRPPLAGSVSIGWKDRRACNGINLGTWLDAPFAREQATSPRRLGRRPRLSLWPLEALEREGLRVPRLFGCALEVFHDRNNTAMAAQNND